MGKRLENAKKRRMEEGSWELDSSRTKKAPWKKRGPCLSERQWGTIRDDPPTGGGGKDASKTAEIVRVPGAILLP